MALYDGSNAPTITVEFDTTKLGAFVIGISPIGGTDVLGTGATTWSAIPTTDVRTLSIRRGRTREDQVVNPGALTLVLENRTSTYDPDNTSSIYNWDGYSLLSAGLGVRVSATWSSTTYVLYRGYLEQLDIDESLDPIATFNSQMLWLGLVGRQLPPLLVLILEIQLQLALVAFLIRLAGIPHFAALQAHAQCNQQPLVILLSR